MATPTPLKLGDDSLVGVRGGTAHVQAREPPQPRAPYEPYAQCRNWLSFKTTQHRNHAICTMQELALRETMIRRRPRNNVSSTLALATPPQPNSPQRHRLPAPAATLALAAGPADELAASLAPRLATVPAAASSSPAPSPTERAPVTPRVGTSAPIACTSAVGVFTPIVGCRRRCHSNQRRTNPLGG